MKKCILTLCSALLLAAITHAQNVFHGGAFFGLSTSQVSGDNLAGFKKAGLYGGAFVNMHLSEKWLLQLETSYCQKGSRKNPKPDKGDYKSYRMNLQYLEVPLLLKWQFSNRFCFELGPAAGYLIKNTGVEKDENGVMPGQPPFNSFELSGLGGFAVGLLQEESFHLKANVRFSQSVIPIRKHSSGAVYWLNRGQYNSVLAFILVAEF
jgi:hypothetical protein